jgi:hypothetical protein
MIVGEDLHKIGEEGALRAKRWLDATTRVKSSWINTDPGAAMKVRFDWPATNTTFSFDLGGVLRGEEFENQMFLAECKKYTVVGNQPSHYREYLAKCYVARDQNKAITDHFMWITWHPFLVESWRNLCSAEEVRKSVVSQRHRVFGANFQEQDAFSATDDKLCQDVAERLWLLVLSDRQEGLVITDRHRGLIISHDVERGVW